MRRRDDSATGIHELGEDRDLLGPGARILPERRLVEHEYARSGREHRRDAQPPLLATGERERVRRGKCVEAQASQQLVDTFVDLQRRELQRARADRELIAHRRSEELVLRLLEHRADAGEQLPRPPPDRMLPRPCAQFAGRLDVALERREKPGERESERRLA